MASRDGYFAPESVIRRVGNSPLVPLLGAGPAVLLQVAHPLVAAGVVSHSDYRNDLWGRLLRTLRALYLIVYGSKQEAERAAAAVRSVHAHVQGTTREQLGPFPSGTPYSAADPELMLWVHATLVSSSLAVQQRFVGRLTASEGEQYYRQMSLVARLFGVPADTIPNRLRDFHDYLEEQLAGPLRLVAAHVRHLVRRDVQALYVHLVAANASERVGERGTPEPQRLHLGPDQDHPRVERLLDGEVAAGTAVRGDRSIRRLILLGAGHETRPAGHLPRPRGSAAWRPGWPPPPR